MMARPVAPVADGPPGCSPMPERTVFFVSDGTGITAETFGNSILAQFRPSRATCAGPSSTPSRRRTRWCARSTAGGRSARASGPSSSSRWSTTRCATSSPARTARAWCWTCSAPSSSRWSRVRRQEQPPRRPLFRRQPEPGIQRPHRGHQLQPGARRRPELAQPRHRRRDPGRRQPQRQDADLAVPGHAARHQGRQLPADPRRLRARHQLPSALAPYKRKCFGLTIDPDRLSQIRHERRPGSRYASLENCRYEVNEAEAMMRREGIAWLSSTPQVDRGDRHHHPARPAARPADLLSRADPPG
jgi:hypothetical protein